jgi:hypothetical protein
VLLYQNLFNEAFSHIFGQSYFFEISTGSERPATTDGHGFCRGWTMLHLLQAVLFFTFYSSLSDFVLIRI